MSAPSRNTMISSWMAAFVIAGCAASPTRPSEAPAPAAAAPEASAATAPAAPPAAAARPAFKGEEVIAKQPAPPALKEFKAPVPKLMTLQNGLKIYVLEKQGGSIESLSLVVRGGATADPDALPGMASMAAEMMEAGSAGKSQAEIAAAVDSIGAALSVGAGQDSMQVGISGMVDRVPQMVKLLSDVALRPNMQPAEWKRLQGQRVAELASMRAQLGFGAKMAFRAAAYGPHPLGRPIEGTPESVQAMTLDQVKKLVQSLSPDEAALIAVGGAPETEVVSRLTAAFAGWKRPAGAAAKASSKPEVPQERPRLVLVDYPEKPQAVVMVGQPAVPRSSPDYLPLTLLNSVLGGSFTSRLNQNLREVHGYTYGSRSSFSFGADRGPFSASAQVKTEVTGPALKEMLYEVGKAVKEPLTAADLSKGRALLAYDLVEMLEHADGAAGAIASIFVFGLPLDEYRTMVDRLKGLSERDVQQAAMRHLQPEKMTITIAGDRKAVEPQLKNEGALSLPTPELRDSAGQVVKAPTEGNQG